MDPYEDVLGAFDDVIHWLSVNPQTVRNDEAFTSNADIYRREMNKRGERLERILEHYEKETGQIQESYSWRRFMDSMRSGCNFDISTHNLDYDQKAQAEHMRIFESARQLVVAHQEGRRPKPKPRPQGPSPARTDHEPLVVKSREHVGKAWPTKLLVAASLGAGTYLAFKPVVMRIAPNIDWNQSMVVAQIATPIAVFMLVLATANTIIKP